MKQNITEEYIRFEMPTGNREKLVIILIPMNISEDELKKVQLFLESIEKILFD